MMPDLDPSVQTLAAHLQSGHLVLFDGSRPKFISHIGCHVFIISPLEFLVTFNTGVGCFVVWLANLLYWAALELIVKRKRYAATVCVISAILFGRSVFIAESMIKGHRFSGLYRFNGLLVGYYIWLLSFIMLLVPTVFILFERPDGIAAIKQ